VQVALDAVIVMLELAENTTGSAELFDIDCLDGYTAADERVAKIEAILGQDRYMLHHPDDDD
jgi:hypothetical protein